MVGVPSMCLPTHLACNMISTVMLNTLPFAGVTMLRCVQRCVREDLSKSSHG